MYQYQVVVHLLNLQRFRPIFGCVDGMGADPRDDLKSTGLMMSIKATGSETTDGQADFVDR